MPNELDDFIVTKTVTEVFAVAASNLADAEDAVAKGEAELVQRNTQTIARPKPPPSTETDPKPKTSPALALRQNP